MLKVDSNLQIVKCKVYALANHIPRIALLQSRLCSMTQVAQEGDNVGFHFLVLSLSGEIPSAF